jgi:hypothetical protein
VYHFDCICGEKVKTPTKTGVCPHCARLFDLRWPNDSAPTADAPERAVAAAAGKQ